MIQAKALGKKLHRIGEERRLASEQFRQDHSFERHPNQGDNGGARANVAESEERILRCLGAAVIMHWSTIPKTLQRELFDTAGSMGDVLKSAAQKHRLPASCMATRQ
jgi:hypothetical protein